jgi:hypothetical protein
MVLASRDERGECNQLASMRPEKQLFHGALARLTKCRKDRPPMKQALPQLTAATRLAK